MCRATTCKVCQKTTWAGCGEHVAAVRRTVPAAQWCGGSHSASEIAASRAERGGFFAKLFGR
ncbi:MAG: hypothetical protein KDB08_02495 [Microthrixaceae bacterium]|nr:hypothetical protein [Microthrixaceae bacterium]